MRRTIVVVLGTRPEAIKLAPVIHALKGEAWAKVVTVSTGQHRQLLDQVLGFFHIVPDFDLGVMEPSQTLGKLTGRLMLSLDDILARVAPDLVLVQGDTTSVLAASIASFYHRIPVGHVEAGLRSGDIDSPFPEEANRRIATHLATWHFAATEDAYSNLIAEGVEPAKIAVTGNTVIDALKLAVDLQRSNQDDLPTKRVVLITLHRRENFGEPLRGICSALRRLATSYPDVTFLWPVHPNPSVQKAAQTSLGDIDNVILAAPLQYGEFVAAMMRAAFIITDSGGVQEEAPALNKPVLVVRNETERTEAVRQRTAKLVGTDEETILEVASRMLSSPRYVQDEFATGISPFGDGLSSQRIATFLRNHMLDSPIEGRDG